MIKDGRDTEKTGRIIRVNTSLTLSEGDKGEKRLVRVS